MKSLMAPCLYKQSMQQLGGTITVLHVHMPRVNKNDNIISITLLVGIFFGRGGGSLFPNLISGLLNETYDWIEYLKFDSSNSNLT